MYNYLIIESNKGTISIVDSVMSDYSSIDCFGTVDNYEIALDTILQNKPDLIFFNIDNVLENVEEFVSDIYKYSEHQPYIIAISSSKAKAYDAIKFNFSDFILTPASKLDVRKSILKFKKKVSTLAKNKICIKSYKDYQYIPTNEILFLKADNNTTDFHLNDGNLITAYKTLKTFESILPDNFLRIHKSYIINMDYVTRVNYGKNSCSLKKFQNNIPFTKTYSENIDSMLKLLSKSSLKGLA